MKNLLIKVSYSLDQKDLKKIIFIFFLTIICSVTELISIGLLIPILHLFTGNEFQNNSIFILKFFNSTNEILYFVLSILLLVYSFKFFVNKTLIKKQNNLAHFLYAKNSKKLFRLYLNKDFSFFIKNNSSDLIRNIMTECSLFSIGIVSSLILLFSEFLIFISISIFLIYYNFQISLFVIIFFTILGTLLLQKNANNLKLWGNKRQYHAAEALKQLQQSFNSFRELIMNNLINIFYNNYSYHAGENARVGANRDTVTQIPRLILEILTIIVLILIIVLLSLQNKSLQEILIILGVFFYSSIRLLPSISKIVKALLNIKYNSIVVNTIYDELKQYNKLFNIKSNEKKKISKFEKIVLDDVSFSYSKEKKILKNINLEIKRGNKIGIIGKTGSGKSTLLNILCGLLNVDEGSIYFDNISNQNKYDLIQNIIGYVPQVVSIFDQSIKFNVCLAENLNEEEFRRLKQSLEIVELSKMVEEMPKKYNHFVGENGSKLSGGQNQRLGIARAIYKNPKILILDEATSGLDLETEEKVIKNILKSVDDITLIIISHRPSTLRFCDIVYEVKNLNVKVKNT